jgi:hypothetical protein
MRRRLKVHPTHARLARTWVAERDASRVKG